MTYFNSKEPLACALLYVRQTQPAGICRWSRGVLSVTGVKEMASKEWLVQLPLIALVSMCGGLLGALFNALHKYLRPVAAPFCCPKHMCRACICRA